MWISFPQLNVFMYYSINVTTNKYCSKLIKCVCVWGGGAVKMTDLVKFLTLWQQKCATDNNNNDKIK